MLGYFCGLGEWGCFHGLSKVWVFQWTGFLVVSSGWVVWGNSLTCFFSGGGVGEWEVKLTIIAW